MCVCTRDGGFLISSHFRVKAERWERLRWRLERFLCQHCPLHSVVPLPSLRFKIHELIALNGDRKFGKIFQSKSNETASLLPTMNNFLSIKRDIIEN